MSVQYSCFELARYEKKPPKCYFNEEEDIISWALGPFHERDCSLLRNRDPETDRPVFHTLDCSIMELADDIAYGIHDLEDIAGRRLAQPDEFRDAVLKAFNQVGGSIGQGRGLLKGSDIAVGFLKGAYERKPIVSKLVNHLVTSACIQRRTENFLHPLLTHEVDLPDAERKLLGALKKVSYELVVERAHVQQLERRGERVVSKLFDAFMEDPEKFVPPSSLEDLRATRASTERIVCDYVAGMTDSFSTMVYHRFFSPGFGSSGDEI